MGMYDLPEPTDNPEVALERVKAYCKAVHTMYDEKQPEPKGLIVDDASDYSKQHVGLAPRHFLLLADLELLLKGIENADQVQERADNRQ